MHFFCFTCYLLRRKWQNILIEINFMEKNVTGIWYMSKVAMKIEFFVMEII